MVLSAKKYQSEITLAHLYVIIVACRENTANEALNVLAGMVAPLLGCEIKALRFFI